MDWTPSACRRSRATRLGRGRRILARTASCWRRHQGQDGQAVGRGHGSGAADARGPLELGQGRRILAGRQAAGVGISDDNTVRLWDPATGAALQTLEGHSDCGQRRRLLAGRQAAGVGIGRRDGQAVGPGHGGGAADARGPLGLRSRPSPSRRTASCWRRHRTTRRSGCGTRPRGRRCRRSRATRTGSWPSRSRRTASCWRRHQGQDGQAVGPGHGSGAADARGPLELGQGRRILAGRQAAGVGIGRQDGQAVGRGHGSGAADARGPLGLRSTAVAFSPDGKLLASASGTRRSGCGTRPRGRRCRRSRATRTGSMAVAFSPDGKLLASASDGQHGQAVGPGHGGGAADARGPLGLGHGRRVLAGRQAAGVGVQRQHGQAVGPGHGGGAADARGPLGLRSAPSRSRRTASCWRRHRGRDGQAVGPGHGGGAADARGPLGLGQGRRILAGRQAAGVGIARQARSGCGTRPRGRRCRRSRATRIRSGPWPSRRTASCWRRHRTTRRSGCGTRPRGRRCRRSRATRASSGPWRSRRTASSWRRHRRQHGQAVGPGHGGGAADARGPLDWVVAVAFSPDGKLLASASSTGRSGCGTRPQGRRCRRSGLTL